MSNPMRVCMGGEGKGWGGKGGEGAVSSFSFHFMGGMYRREGGGEGWGVRESSEEELLLLLLGWGKDGD